MEREKRGPREPQSLEAWESWVDHLIVEAQERGDFDNLPGHGKPLAIEDAPFAGGLEVGFGLLKNAGVAPFWVELDKEIRAKTERMEELTRRAVDVARERPVDIDRPGRAPIRARRWRPFARRSDAEVAPSQPALDRREVTLARLRREYLELAEERARLIAQYNAAIPRDLWHLERVRPTLDEAAQAFDGAVSGV